MGAQGPTVGGSYARSKATDSWGCSTCLHAWVPAPRSQSCVDGGRGGGGEKTGLTSTGYGPSRAAASKLGASLSGPGSPGVAVTTGVTAEGGGGGERDGGLGERGPPASRSSSRAMVGEAAVSRDTAWSCLASVTSTPLICKSQLVRGAMGRPWWRECRSGAPVHSPTGHGRRPAECLPGGQRRPQRCGR